MPTPPIIDSSTSGSMDGRGSFVVGSTAQFFFTFSDINGDLFDPSNIDITIFDPSGDSAETFDGADKLEDGVFGILWDIPSDADAGKYSIEVNYTVETSSGADVRTLVEYFVVLESGQGATSLRSVSVRAFLETFLRYSQRIPVFNEPGRLNKSLTTAEFSFPRWNQTAGVKVWVNNTLKESGYTVNYLKGKIVFDNPLSQYDQVMASYTFRWFTDAELNSFIEQGINVFNIFPPQSVYVLNNIPDRFLIIGIHAAAVFALRTWMMDIQFQEPAKIFGGLERAQQVFQNMEALKKNYEEMLKLMLEQKKYGPYLGLTKTITTPEFTLPGGRSRWFRYLFKG